MIDREILLLGRWSKDPGNVPNAEQKSQNFLSNRQVIDLSIAATVIQRDEPKDLVASF
jgi:hypothetical protein